MRVCSGGRVRLCHTLTCQRVCHTLTCVSHRLTHTQACFKQSILVCVREGSSVWVPDTHASVRVREWESERLTCVSHRLTHTQACFKQSIPDVFLSHTLSRTHSLSHTNAHSVSLSHKHILSLSKSLSQSFTRSLAHSLSRALSFSLSLTLSHAHTHTRHDRLISSDLNLNSPIVYVSYNLYLL